MPEWQAFLQPYLAVRAKTDPYLPDRLHLYLALFPIFWLTVFIGVGLKRVETSRLTGWSIEGLSVNQKLQRYLARGLAWPKSDFASQLEALDSVMFFPHR